MIQHMVGSDGRRGNVGDQRCMVVGRSPNIDPVDLRRLATSTVVGFDGHGMLADLVIRWRPLQLAA